MHHTAQLTVFSLLVDNVRPFSRLSIQLLADVSLGCLIRVD